MDRTIETAGYVIMDKEGVIWAVAETVEKVWGDFSEEMRANGCRILEDDEPKPQYEAFDLISNYKVFPATKDLMDYVYGSGGYIQSEQINGIRCTTKEFEGFRNDRI